MNYFSNKSAKPGDGQTQLKNRVSRPWFSGFKKTASIIITVQMVLVSVMPAALYPLPVKAAASPSAIEVEVTKPQFDEVTGNQKDTINAVDKDTKTTNKNLTFIQRLQDWWGNFFKVRDWGWESLKDSVYAAAKTAVSHMLNTFAYDTATWLATGDEGQKPMFYTKGWGAYLKDLADAAGGKFLESLSGSWLHYNVCEPASPIKIRISLGISELGRPKPPKCTVTQLVKNWQSFAKDPNFLNKFTGIFEPSANDIGIAFSMFDFYYQTKAKDELAGILGRQEGQGWKSVGQKIADSILTPSSLVSEASYQALSKGTKAAEDVPFGDIFGYAIATFANTLMSKLFDKWFRQGLASNAGNDENYIEDLARALAGLLPRPGPGGSQDLYTGDTGVSLYGGKKAAERRFLDFLEAGVKPSSDYDLLSKLSFCPDPKNPGSEECVISPAFRDIIERKMTLKDALKAGLIDGEAPFGAWNFDPTAKNLELSYRNIVIMRSYRIVPVGWELAAEAGHLLDPGKIITLNYLVSKFNDPNDAASIYHGLIDPDWVLKLPEVICKNQGFGPKIIYQAETGSSADEAASLDIGRAEYCADFQSCISRNNDGTCRNYGYCSEEKRVWDLAGKDCSANYNTCQTFQSSSGSVASYLANSLNYNGCSINNAGCKWYCQTYNPVDNIWTCVNEGKKVLKPCTQKGGCPVTASCDIPNGLNFCLDANSQVNLTISDKCSSGSKFWVASGSKCVVNTGCTIKQNGVSCAIDSCSSLDNLLPNPSFETAVAPATGQLSLKWQGNREYFSQVAGGAERIYADGGQASLRFFNYGSVIDESATSAELELPAGDYTFSSQVYDYLNQGDVTLKVTDALASSVLGEKMVNKENGWQQISFDFKVTAAGNGKGKVKVGIEVGDGVKQVSGVVWFDNFRISKSCITNRAVLTLVGTIDRDESKLYLDRDAGSCSAEEAGCSEFIQTLPNAGTNLIDNASFEDWPDASSLPKGWFWGESHQASDNASIEQIQNDCPVGKLCLKINNDNLGRPRDFDTGPVTGLKANTTYRISFWAKTDSTTKEIKPEDGLWYLEILSDHNPDHFCSLNPALSCEPTNDLCTCADGVSGCPAGGRNQGKCLADFSPLQINNSAFLHLTDQWQRFVANPITTRISSDNFKLSIANLSTDNTKPLYLDGVQIEEVETKNPVTTSYKDYGAANLTYLKKAPVSLDCKGYSLDRPNPAVLDGVTKAQCVGDTLVWRKFCQGGDKAGQGCSANSDCGSGTCAADSCDAAGNFCCHEVDSPQCANYALYCQQDEVGCEAYTPLKGGTTIPGVVKLEDYCPAECVGYDSYKQSNTFFESQASINYFIPATGKQCNAASAGCDEFTNLDEVAKGGEGKEYYKYLRLCEKPNDPGVSCQNFYNWQGSDEAGYQLKVYNLAAAAGSPQAAMDISSWLPYWCADTAAGANGQPACCDGPEDIISNPFCKEFYGIDGNIYYRIYNNTIACSDDCHPFRKSRLNEGDAEATANCTASHGTWDGSSKTCVYQAIPSQGLACSNNVAGCREYSGNASGNVFTAFADNFEPGDTVGWKSGTISSEALSVGGHSIKSQQLAGLETIASAYSKLSSGGNCTESVTACSGNNAKDCFDRTLGKCVSDDTAGGQVCLINVGESSCSDLSQLIKPIKTYLISFWAKGSTTNTIPIKVKLASGSAGSAIIQESTNLGSDWNYYNFGPFTMPDAIPSDLALSLTGENGGTPAFYADNIEIKEVQNYVYEIKNSWKTPNSCDTNPWLSSGPIAAPQFMLGCKQYRDSYSRTHNLKSFDHLCRQEVIGCQALIDTFNSASPYEPEVPFNANDPISAVSVPADKLVYLVNRPQFQCTAANKGCQALGWPQISTADKVVGYQTAYLINDPDKYSSILCQSSEFGCDEFRTGNGTAYFKDPGAKTCEYRVAPGQASSAWFKSGSASTIPDCPLVQPPVGAVHPSNGWTGLCPGEFNSCTQFIDPVSTIAKNLIFNGDLSRDSDNNSVPDGWVKGADNYTQEGLQLEANTLYTLSFTAKKKLDGSLLVIEMKDCPNAVSFDHSIEIASDNKSFKIPPRNYQADSRTIDQISNFPAETTYSVRFTVPKKQVCKLDLKGSDLDNIKDSVKQVNLFKTGIYYTLSNTVDEFSCNGIVDPERGCVLFNDRSQVNFKIGEDDISSLGFDADTSGINVNNGLPVANCSGSCDSNAVLKVTPDRECEAWLACTSYAVTAVTSEGEQKQCLSLGLCNAADESGICTNFVPAAGKDSSGNDLRKSAFSTVEEIKNLSGYATAGLSFNQGVCANGMNNGAACNSKNDCTGSFTTCARTINGYFPYAEMTQYGNAAYISNGDFELAFNQTNQPLAWSEYSNQSSDHTTDGRGWMPYKYTLETNSKQRLEGRYLKLNTSYEAKSSEIDLEKNTDYILTAWINTEELKHDDPTMGTLPGTYLRGQVCYYPEIESSCRKEGDYYNSGSKVCCPKALVLPSGNKWQKLTYDFNSGDKGSKMTLYLSNYASDVATCRDGKDDTKCGISGYSLFDQISLKPVLQVKNVTSNDLNFAANDFVSRSCRVYPEYSSLACEYIDAKNIYHIGQYGYCLTADPNNPQQCVQWLPIDQIKGEMADEVVPYQIQTPLYYCVQKGEMPAFPSTQLMATFNTYTSYSAGSNDNQGRSVQLVPFQINEDYRPLFRYPYVRQIKGHFKFEPDNLPAFAMRGLGMVLNLPPTVDSTPFGPTGNCDPNIDHIQGCDVTFNLQSQGSEIYGFLPATLSFIVPWSAITGLIGALGGDPGISQLIGSALDIVGNLAGGSPGDPSAALLLNINSFKFYNSTQISSASYIDDMQTFQSQALFLNLFTQAGSALLGFAAGGDMENIAAALQISSGVQFSAKIGMATGVTIVTENDPRFTGQFVDPMPDIPNDIYGVAVINLVEGSEQAPGVYGNFKTNDINVNYCKQVVQVVDATGNNKAWSTRVAPGSQYLLPDPNSKKVGASYRNYYLYYDPFNYDQFLTAAQAVNGNIDSPDFAYQSSDYEPFGAIVPPAGLQNPPDWDSRTTNNRQPLFYEPPQPSLGAPYQARMGELHDINYLKRIFLKSYGTGWDFTAATGGLCSDNSANCTVTDKSLCANTNTATCNINHFGDGYKEVSNSNALTWDCLANPPINCGSFPRCGENKRPAGNPDPMGVFSDVCWIEPAIPSTLVNGQKSTVINGVGAVKLDFTVKVDANQLPLKSYSVDWQDGEKTSVSGVSLRERPNLENPFTIYHTYDYWQLKRTSNSPNRGPNLDCPADQNYCLVKPVIEVQDNWNKKNIPSAAASIKVIEKY